MVEFWSWLEEALYRPLFKFGEADITLSALLASTAILLVAMLLSRILRRLVIRKLFPRTRFGEGTQFVVRRAIHYGVLTLGVLIAVDTLGVNLSALSVFAGLVGIGIGFGLQNIVNNFISGFTLLLERPVQVGDYVEFEGHYGRVDGIHSRSTSIVTIDNVTLVVPNSRLTDNTVVNWTTGDPKTRLRVGVGVSYASDPHEVRRILLEVCAKDKEILDSPAPEVCFKAFGESSLDFEVLFWTDRPRMRFVLMSALHFEIWDALKAAGVEIQFPQRDVHLRQAS